MQLLADALPLSDQQRIEFETAAGRHAAPAGPEEDGGGSDPDATPRHRGGAGGVVSIHAIGRMAGCGKTALAVRAAHALADRFPAGQIFLPLHAHTPGISL